MANGSGLPDAALAPDTSGYGALNYDSALAPDPSKGFFGPLDNIMNSLRGYNFGGGSPLLGSSSSITPGGVGNNSGFLGGLFSGGDGEGSGANTLSQIGNIAGIGKGLFDGYLGLKEYKLMEDMFDFKKESFNRQFAANKKLTNTALNNRYISNNNARGADAVGPNPFGTLEEYKARTNVV